MRQAAKAWEVVDFWPFRPEKGTSAALMPMKQGPGGLYSGDSAREAAPCRL